MRKMKKVYYKFPALRKKKSKLIVRNSAGIAIREKKWTGFGAGVGLLGYDESDDRNSDDANRLNVEDVNFVNALLDDDDNNDDTDVNEGAD